MLEYVELRRREPVTTTSSTVPVLASADSFATASIVDDSNCSSWANAADAENTVPRRVAAASGFNLNISVQLLFL